MAKVSDILQYGSYRVCDCTDFQDIANTIENILCNCSIYKVSIFDFPAVYNRITGLAKLYRSNEKFRNQSDIDWAKVNCSYYTDIMFYVDNFGLKA